MNRLAGLARKRLSGKMRRRVDPEDVVQSAFRTFFRHASEDRFELKRSGDLWRLLAAITIHKTMGQVEYHQAAKRSVAGEETWGTAGNSSLNLPTAITPEPSAAEAVAFADEIESYMDTLDPLRREVFALRLQDVETIEIAKAVQRSARTVRRILEEIRANLTDRLNRAAMK